jgi:hypothetical protein
METRDNILNELKQIAPTLAAMEKKNFYALPDGYFADFKSNIMAQVKLSAVQQELKRSSSKLVECRKKTGGRGAHRVFYFVFERFGKTNTQ